jgi:CheY-like chemotaxis protein
MATILVVDDDFTNRQILTTILGYRAHNIVEAAVRTGGFDQRD